MTFTDTSATDPGSSNGDTINAGDVKATCV